MHVRVIMVHVDVLEIKSIMRAYKSVKHTRAYWNKVVSIYTHVHANMYMYTYTCVHVYIHVQECEFR